MTPEFSRPYRLDTLGQPKDVDIAATPDEAAALAQRFGLQGIEKLAARARIIAGTDGIDVTGRMTARATQSCVVTGDAVPAVLDQDFAIRFIAPDAAMPEAEEIELSAEDCDVMEHDGQAIDLGEAVAQTLGLALDPYPRSAGAQDRLKAAGVLSEEQAGPFGALAALKDKLKKD
ncbi:MAG: YceD family protein [Chakrabartia sp.]